MKRLTCAIAPILIILAALAPWHQAPACAETACPPHDMAVIYSVAPTCQSDGSITRQCLTCGLVTVDVVPATGVHEWVSDGDAHVCVSCGLREAHDDIPAADGHVCAACGRYTEHTFFSLNARQHACASCSYTCEHDMIPSSHSCALCPYMSEHEYAPDAPHTCLICGQVTDHVYDPEDPHLCVICGQVTDHVYDPEDPHLCLICGQVSAHQFSADDPHLCVICGLVTMHVYPENEPHRCSICGAWTDHDWVLTSQEDGGLYQPGLAVYRCALCGEIEQRLLEPAANDPAFTTAALAMSCDGGALTLRERTAGELMAAEGGMTLRFEAEDLAFDPADAAGIALTASGGLQGMNVFLANATVDGHTLTVTVYATEARMGQSISEPGEVCLSLPFSGAVVCRSAAGEVSFVPSAQPGASDGAPLDDPAAGLTVGGEGLTDYAIVGSTAYIAMDGRVWVNTLGTALYAPIDGGDTRTGQRTAIRKGRLVFED